MACTHGMAFHLTRSLTQISVTDEPTRMTWASGFRSESASTNDADFSTTTLDATVCFPVTWIGTARTAPPIALAAATMAASAGFLQTQNPKSVRRVRAATAETTAEPSSHRLSPYRPGRG